ncbi:MAG: transglutaminase-like domain-containing protein [Archaeoglobaceae archaeon]
MKFGYFLAILSLFTLLLCVGLTKEEYCQKTWRYDLECALNTTLSDEEIAKISVYALKLKGKNCVETAWNVLKWVGENIEYDKQKASLPPPVILVRGREVQVLNSERFYQTPIETAKLRRGICGDFAIFTTAVLLYNNCSAFVLHLEFEKEETGHLSSVILLDQFYVLDQNLPPLDLGSYYKKWLREGKKVQNLSLCEKNGCRKLELENLPDYKFSAEDMELIRKILGERLRKSMLEDQNLDSKTYRKSAIITARFHGYADYYTPVFSSKISEMIAEELEKEIEKTNEKWNSFKITIQTVEHDIEIKLEIAK